MAQDTPMYLPEAAEKIFRACFLQPGSSPSFEAEPPGSLEEAMRVAFGQDWRKLRIIGVTTSLGEDLGSHHRESSAVRQQLRTTLENLWILRGQLLREGLVEFSESFFHFGEDLQIQEDERWKRIVTVFWTLGIIDLPMAQKYLEQGERDE